MSQTQLVSVIIPVYNEETNIPCIYKELTSILQHEIANDYEIIFVNDGSKDASWYKICQLAHNDKHIKALNFSRNFGHQIALTAGYDIASGEAIITMDADMQDPPSVLIQLIAKWKEGADI